MVVTVLSGHVSAETAFIQDDYPYGYRLRCQRRVWIETSPKHGQRVVSQTTNPKKPGVVWNKPKASTYSNLRVLFLDEQGYVQNQALSFYDGTDTIAAFEAVYGAAFTSERDQRELRLLKAVAARQDAITAARKAAEAAQL